MTGGFCPTQTSVLQHFFLSVGHSTPILWPSDPGHMSDSLYSRASHVSVSHSPSDHIFSPHHTPSGRGDLQFCQGGGGGHSMTVTGEGDNHYLHGESFQSMSLYLYYSHTTIEDLRWWGITFYGITTTFCGMERRWTTTTLDTLQVPQVHHWPHGLDRHTSGP